MFLYDSLNLSELQFLSCGVLVMLLIFRMILQITERVQNNQPGLLICALVGTQEMSLLSLSAIFLPSGEAP